MQAPFVGRVARHFRYRPCRTALSAFMVTIVVTIFPVLSGPGPLAAQCRAAEIDSPGWDRYVLFLLRLLYQIYDEDTGEIPDPIDVPGAMQLVTNTFAATGTPAMSVAERVLALTTIEETYRAIVMSSHGSESAYTSFLSVLTQMYEELGGDPGELGR